MTTIRMTLLRGVSTALVAVGVAAAVVYPSSAYDQAQGASGPGRTVPAVELPAGAADAARASGQEVRALALPEPAPAPVSAAVAGRAGPEIADATDAAGTLAAAPATAAPAAPPPPAPATTTPPPPPPQAPPAPAAASEPRSAPPTTQAPAPVDPYERAMEALTSTVPAGWQRAISHRLEIIEGDTSWARSDGLLRIARAHATGDWDVLRFVVAHEFGHLVAFVHGTGQYAGAPPEGFPYHGPRPEEMWADCVATVWTGLGWGSHGLPGCPGDALSWTRSWLSGGPPR